MKTKSETKSTAKMKPTANAKPKPTAASAGVGVASAGAKANPSPAGKLSQNGISRPKSAEGIVGSIWQFCDSESLKNSEPVARREVLAWAKSQDIKESTATAQHARWRRFYGLTAQKTPEELAARAEAKAKAKAAKADAEEDEDISIEDDPGSEDDPDSEE